MNSEEKRIPRVERLNDAQPIISKIPSSPWQNKVTFNPACAFVADHGELLSIIEKLPFNENVKKTLRTQPALCFLLYRAQGKKTEAYDFTRSSIGLAILSPTLQLLARHSEPVILPDVEYDNLGVEDARITKVGDRYVMFYTAYAAAQPENKIRIALASTTDFVNWRKHGLLKGELNQIHNKNAMLFERTINGKYVMLHRPMEGVDAMAIHWASVDDIYGEWVTKGTLMKPITNASFIDTWIGGGAPPLRLPDGRYLIIYHIGNRKADTTREYDLGIAVADFSSDKIIIKRNEPLLRPESQAETSGDAELGVNNVVFICGAYFYDGDLYFPYAGADSVVLGGKIPKVELDRYLTS
jgi:beta-1,2-mannobiose phosphorylase / 1,2-beta-oligomannan phosphorylase